MAAPVVIGYDTCQGPGCTNPVKIYEGRIHTKWCSRTCKDRDYKMRRPDMYERKKARSRIQMRLRRRTLTRGMLVCSGVLAPAPLTPRAQAEQVSGKEQRRLVKCPGPDERGRVSSLDQGADPQ